MTEITLRIEHDTDAPQAFAIWSGDDLIGTGDALSEAMEDACATLQSWQFGAKS